ncbi:MAG: DUF559 domain-containing protein [Bacteroidales bacterium]|nr:DUF559 domain-containing protein [Bacteroidales bacterium]
MNKRKYINESKQCHGANLSIKSNAKELRKRMTEVEKILWKGLRMKQLKGMYFRRQHPYGIYILDFFCSKAGFVIELDGEIHQYRKDYDAARTEFLESTGLKLIRFTNDDVINRIDWVVEEITKHL